jgi:tetratricopeptide (TPR) repeat protein
VHVHFIDSTAVCFAGPGSPAYFSRFAAAHLQTFGHTVTIGNRFDASVCQAVDAVVCEWANQEAYEAAASGVCKRLIVRMRGFDAHGPLDRLEWGNVDALVYESPFLKSYVEDRFPGLRGFRSHVMPSGVDVANIPFKERKAGPVVALVARADAAKGFQLAFEWARWHPGVTLHVAMALGASNPRLMEYARHIQPDKVKLYPGVDTVKWLDEIDANFLLSASIWETLGYTIAEAMAMGIKPLIHDAPGVQMNWQEHAYAWRTFGDLDSQMRVADLSYRSTAYRAFVEEHLDAAKQSAKFADLIQSIPARVAKLPSAAVLIARVESALTAQALDQADAALLDFRTQAPRMRGLDDHRAGLALKLASAYADAGDFEHARVWALRSLGDVVRSDALYLLGEIAAVEGNLENAARWYDAGLGNDDQPTRYYTGGLAENAEARRAEIEQELRPRFPLVGSIGRFLIVVAVRNAQKYIGPCLESIKAQGAPLRCVVVDDASTDETAGVIAATIGTDPRFRVLQRNERRHSLRNIVEAIQEYGRAGDVVAIVDGDDKLQPDALAWINGAYMRGAWMTYGSFTTSTGRPNWMPPYPHHVVEANAFRSWPWSVPHPKTFRKELFDKIDPADFQHEGQWFQTAGDVALMIPMLEMAGHRALYIPEVLYEYTEDNPRADHRVDPDGQVRVRNLILAKKPYARLEKL